MPWVLFGGALVACLLLALKLLDAGLILDNARTQSDLYRARTDLALRLIQKEWIGRPTASVNELAEELRRSGTNVGRDGATVEIGDLRFETDGGKVTAVRFLD